MERNKRLGQHFLKSSHLLNLIARLAGVTGKRVLEIGAGDGRLTKRLMRYKPKALYAIEKDARFVKQLAEKYPQLLIIEGDVLKEEWPEVDVVVGNIPYNISSKLLFKLCRKKVEKALLMFQLEFAQRLVAKAGERNYGRLSVSAQLCFEIEIIRRIAPRLFSPPPKVESALVKLTPKRAMDSAMEEFIRKIFQHKNQLLQKVLKRAGYDCPPEYRKKRARELSPPEVEKLFRLIHKQRKT